MKILGWLRRDRVAEVMASHDDREKQDASLGYALHEAAERIHPARPLEWAMWGSPDTARFPDTCVAGDPCGMKFSNEADRGYWYHCGNHQPRGRHRLEDGQHVS